MPAAPAATKARPVHRLLPDASEVFEYVGEDALSVFSPRTGKRYRFDRPGARVEADARDVAWLAFVPKLKRVT